MTAISYPEEGSAELSLQRRRLVYSGVAGTAIEFYDFFLYGFMAPQVFDKLFFPKLDPLVATLTVLATYGIGYGARPIGGILFGHFGDRIGRKPVLFVTLALMGVSSTLIGLLPTYGQIGIAAPIVLIILRCLQGIALGGESTGAPVLAMESAPFGKRGGMAGLIQIGGALGSLMASGAGSLATRLPPEQFLDWGWRIPFIISFLLVGVGLYVRSRVSESPVFKRAIAAEPPEKVPVAALFRRAKKPLAIVLFVALAESAMVNFFSVWGTYYGIAYAHVDRGTMLSGILIGSCFGLVTNPGFGRLTDFVGRRTILILGFIAAALWVAFAFFPLIATGDPLLVIIAMAVPAGITQPMIFAVEASFYAECFDEARLRFSGAALGRQLGNAIGGGTMPVVATALLAGTGTITAPIVYYAAISLISVIAVLWAPETNRKTI